MSAVLSLRQATLADAQLLLDWANDPADRAASFDSRPIPLNRHVRWLDGKLTGGHNAFYVCEDAVGPVGCARVERVDAGVGEISVSIDEAHRGRGLGRTLIALAAESARHELRLERIEARVKRANAASLRAFAAAGFVEAADTLDGGVVLVWEPAA